MKKETLSAKIIVITSAIMVFMFLFCEYLHADCIHVWKPGTVMYVDVGHPVHFIVEEEDVPAFKRQTTLPITMLPFPPKQGMEKAMDDIRDSHYCGEYREVTDEDLMP